MATSTKLEHRGRVSWEKGITWDNVYMEEQKRAMIAVCVELLEVLLNMDAAKTLIKMILVSGYHGKYGDYLCAKKGGALVTSKMPDVNVAKERWAEMLEKYNVTPDQISDVIDKIERKLGGIKKGDDPTNS